MRASTRQLLAQLDSQKPFIVTGYHATGHRFSQRFSTMAEAKEAEEYCIKSGGDAYAEEYDEDNSQHSY
jgi:hypothetical protein